MSDDAERQTGAISDEERQAIATIKERVSELCRRAASLRSTPFLPSPDAPPGQWDTALHTVRDHLDRIEEIYVDVLSLKSGVKLRWQALDAAAEDAWDRKADAAVTSGRRQQYQGSEERYAVWRVQTWQERRDARDAKQLYDFVADAAQRIEIGYRGLIGTRQYLISHIKYLQWESVLER